MPRATMVKPDRCDQCERTLPDDYFDWTYLTLSDSLYRMLMSRPGGDRYNGGSCLKLCDERCLWAFMHKLNGRGRS